MAPPPTLLSLPREIRDAIYEHYVTFDGGLVCDSEKLIASRLKENGISRKPADVSVADILRTRDDRPIDVNLVYTCKMIRDEMDGFALFLRFNTIHFSTVTSTDIRVLAARFDCCLHEIDLQRNCMLQHFAYALPESSHKEIKSRYPEFAPCLDILRGKGYVMCSGETEWWCGEVPSRFRRFAKETLEVAVLSPMVTEKLPDNGPGGVRSFREKAYKMPRQRLEVVSWSVEKWAIPFEDDIQGLGYPLYESGSFVRFIKRNGDRTKFRFSAAAAAIHFLQYLPATMRAKMRNIVLDEDHEAVAKPQCHALGLIPFCLENPLLRVERRVSLWNNVFLPDRRYSASENPEHRYQPGRRHAPWALDSKQITRNLSEWIVEALALGPAGMPASSFSLLLDGQPVPQQCAQIFQLIVQRDASWQAAWIESLDRGFLPEQSWVNRRGKLWEDLLYPERLHSVYPGYTFECLPQALRDITNNKSIVRCNFDVGEPLDVESIIHEHRSWTIQTWREEWAKHEPATWEPAAPLPGLRAILERNLVPKKARYRRGAYRDSTY